MEGFPIRKSADITAICASPRLIAACHVLLRLLMPRHSPYALVRLNFLYIFLYFGSLWIVWVSLNIFVQDFIDSFSLWKDFLFAFCTLFWVCAFAPRLRAFHLSVKLYFPFSFGKTNISLKIICPLLFVFYSKNFFFYSIVKDLLESLWIPASFALAKSCRTRFSEFCGRSGWTRTIDLALIRRAL